MLQFLENNNIKTVYYPNHYKTYNNNNFFKYNYVRTILCLLEEYVRKNRFASVGES